MSGEFFERKIRTLFHRFDLDKSGTIEESDFDKWTEKLVSFGNLNGEQVESLKKNIKSLWSVYFAPADADGDGTITSQELINHIKKVSTLY
jgi:Ca2+-binding EF-hand superfamily protein